MSAVADSAVPLLLRGYGVVAALLVAFILATDVLALAFAQEFGAVLLLLGLPWPVLVGVAFGYSKVAALAAMALGLSANWTLLVLARTRWHRRREAARVRLLGD